MSCGTNANYNKGCKCDECKEAHAAAQRIYNANHYRNNRPKILAMKKLYDAANRSKKQQTVKPGNLKHDWMDKRAEEVWQKHKDRQPDYPMYRSPLRDLT